jgi:hypothetical protein
MRSTWESLIRDFVRHLKGTNRALSTQTIYRRAAAGLVDHLVFKAGTMDWSLGLSAPNEGENVIDRINMNVLHKRGEP